MLSKKIDVDRHVEYTIKRINSESERNLRSYAFAKLYFNVSEYEQARRYISNYLIVKPKSAEGHLLLGNILEKLGKREAALEAYRNSLDIDPKQNSLVLKVCELLASDDITLDATRARYWCEQASLLDPQHPAVFDLRERLATADSTGSDDILKLFISELENRPTDVGLRVRLLQHMLDYNKLALAYEHVSEIEEKNLPIFADHLVWYETVAKILVRYKNENIKNTSSLTWQFWMLIVSVFDKLVSLSLDENISSSKNLSDCVRAIFNLDQTLSAAADNINSQCMEKQLTQEFLIHYRAQLCFHIATLIFKQAKKDQIKYKEAINFAIPLCLISYHSQPIELQCVWLEHASDQTRKLAHRWHREAAYRCSQAGHTLLSLVRERRSAFGDRVAQLSAGAWRDRIYKNIFITRDQQLKIKTSYFVNCLQLEEVSNRLPDNVDLVRYDETAQLVHPNSLHHMIWIGLNIQPVKFNCTVFEGLQYSVKNLSNCAAETLNLLDIQAFLYCSIFCAQANIEESKHLIYYNQEKPTVLPAAITEPYGTLNQTKWFSCVHKMYSNESGSDLSDIRVTLIKGIEIVRCAGTHGLDVKLLVLLANTFAQKAKILTKPSEIEYTEARAELYWKNAIPMLEKIRNNQAISYPTKRWFEYRGKDISPSELNMYIEDGKLFSAVQLMKKKEHEKALQMLETLKNPYASFYQAQTYKLLADEQMSHHKENVTSEMRSQHIILLSKARDCYYLTLDRLREPSVDRKHPLNAELGTEIEKIERLLSRIDPDICANRNECDGMSDENVSSVGSVGEHVNVNSSNYMMMSASNSYHLGNMSTPRHDHHATYRIGGMGAIGDSSLLNSSARREARPSPERLDAQLRQMAAAKDATYQHILEQHRIIMDTHRSLVDELRGFKEAVHGLTSSVDEIRNVKKSVEELKTVSDDIQNMKEQIYEIKKDLTELKKDTNKLKSNQINEEDLYALEEEYGVDYNINQAAGTSGFNSAAALYPNFPQRLQGAAAAAAAAATANMYSGPGLYGMYPMYPPYGSLGLSQPGALPFPDGVGAHIPDFRGMGSIGQGLSHAGLGNQPQATNLNMFGKYDNNTLPPQQSLTNVPTTPTPLLPSLPTAPIPIPLAVTVPSFQATASATTITNVPVNKAPPVNVVITASDPLPTTVSTTTSAQILSVTIPPQHLKGNVPKPHNYQIPLPTTSQPSFVNVQSAINQTPLPVTTQNLLSNVAPPIYSSLTVKSPSQQASHNSSSSNLGLQIEKSLSQSFPSTPTNNTTFTDTNISTANITQKTDLNKSNVSEGSYLEEHDPCPDFKPIIPLPDEVPLTTGEEQETVLFCAHAKLYRFVEKEWRERGIGNIKLLYNEQTGKVRVLMRRDQVHKICANHYLTEDLQLTPMVNNERAYVWAANDFADENVVLEKLCVRFKTVEEAKKFATEFENAKALLSKPSTSVKSDLKDVKKTLFPNTVSTPPTTNKENSLGGFVFTSTPTFKPKTDLKPEASLDTKQKTDSATPKSSPFVGFSFGLQQQSKTPSSIGTPTSTTLNESIKSSANTSQPNKNNDDGDDDFVPTTEFKPVIPLPDLVEVKTGEENSEVLYEVKAKLHRFDSTLKEWKERGVGIIKILKDKTIRLLMRREQVHKICCNHQVLKSMVFTNAPKDNRVLNWCAQDFSENVLKPEMFAIRFRTPEICEEFLQMIHKAQSMLDSSNNVMSGATIAAVKAVNSENKLQQAAVGGWGDAYKMKEGNWECGDCYVSNTSKNSNCVACGTPRPRANNKSDNAQSPQKFKPSPAPTVQPIKENKHKVGTWECKTCFIHNDGKNKNCEACDTPKSESKKDDLNVSGGAVPSPAASNVSSTTTTNTTSGWGDLFKPKTGAWNCKACYLSNEASSVYCIACESPKDDTIPKKENKGLDLGSSGGQKFSFGIPASASPAAPAVKPAEQSTIFGLKAQPTAGFTFGMPQNPLTVTSSTGFSFGVQKPPTTAAETTSTPLNLTSKPTFTFSLSTTNTTATETGRTTPPTTKNEEFVFGSPNKHEFEFKPRSPRKVSGGDGDESDEGGLEEECDNIYFKPVIPLPDKVEVKTGEEDEKMLYCHRAKLYRFVDGEWKERGVGDVKILKNPQSAKLRVVMRRDQIHKICLNHALTNEIEYKSKDDKTWLFSAPDYSESEIVFNQFCLRFKTSEIAQQFLDAINKARNDSTSLEQSTVIETTATATSSSITSIEKSKSQDDDDNDNDDSDIEIVYETVVSPELQEKALALKLPKNFYAYLTKEPCKGCIGCNDENFVFNTTSSSSCSGAGVKPPTSKTTVEFTFDPKTSTSSILSESTTMQSVNSSSIFGTPLNSGAFNNSSTFNSVVDTPKSSTTSNVFGSGSGNSVFGTPQTPNNIFATNTTSNTNISTPKFNFTTSTTAPAATNNKPFSSPFNFTPSTVAPPTNLFGGATTITPVQSNNSAPTLTKLLTQPSQLPTVSATDQHKSPLAPSKLANVLTASSQNTNIFSGSGTPTSTPPATTNLFGGGKSQNTENQLPQLNTNKAPIFGGGGSIFGGVGSTATATATPIFGASTTTTQTKNIFGGAAKTETPVFGNSGSLFGQQTPASNMSIFGNLSANTPTFGSLAAATKPSTNAQTTEKKDETKPFSFAPAFGGTTPTKPAEAPLLKCDSSLSFAALASTNQGFNTPSSETTTEIKPFSFAGAGSQVFGSSTKSSLNSSKTSSKPQQTKTGDEDEAEDGADDTTGDATEEYDPHYEPIVPLPDAIDVKTGEEDEEVTYNERAKLYRYSTDTKEWKERGVGQLKILYHPTNCTYRLLLRREQVHKLVLNQLITIDMDLQPMQMSDRAWLWAGFNHSEDGSQLEKLAVRFKNPELAIKFRDAVAQAQKYLQDRPQTSRTEDIEDEEEDIEGEGEDEEDIYEEYGSDESDENKSIMFSKRCTLSYKNDDSNEWTVLGMGIIKIFYDSEMYGGRIEMADDTGAQLSNTIIAMNTVMKVEDTCCLWRAMEWTLDPSVPRVLRAQFSSSAAAQEMYYNYEEALQYAQHSEIYDTLPE